MAVAAADLPEATSKGYRATIEALQAGGIEAAIVAVTAQDARLYDRAVVRPRTDIVGAVEAAEILGVSRTRVHQLAERPDFPKPLYELAAGKLWLRDEIEEFRNLPRRGGRPRKAKD